jgi:hypothetical protein
MHWIGTHGAAPLDHHARLGWIALCWKHVAISTSARAVYVTARGEEKGLARPHGACGLHDALAAEHGMGNVNGHSWRTLPVEKARKTARSPQAAQARALLR